MYLKPIGKTTVNRPQAILPPNAGSFAASVLLVIRKDLFAEPWRLVSMSNLTAKQCEKLKEKKRKCLLAGMQNLFDLSQKQKLFLAERCCSTDSALLSTAKLLTLIKTRITLPTPMLIDANLLLNLTEDIHSRKCTSVRFFKIASRKIPVVTLILREWWRKIACNFILNILKR